MGAINDRLTRLEEQGARCPGCGLTPDERRPIAAVYDEPGEGFEGDPYETCSACGGPLYTVIRVVYGNQGGGASY